MPTSIDPTWEAYYIPGTRVLKNKLGITNQTDLAIAEARFTRSRAHQLMADPINGSFDYSHMKTIHYQLFQDVYDWAGVERTGPMGQMTKVGADGKAHAYYPAGPALTQAAHAQYAQLRTNNLLRGLHHADFTAALADFWGEINVVHSFREGNTRSQLVFMEELITHAGYRLDLTAFAPGDPRRDAFVQARFDVQDSGSSATLADFLRNAAIPVPVSQRVTALPAPTRSWHDTPTP